MYIHLILSGISILFGFAAFFVFLIMHNFQASIWGFMTGIVSCLLLHIHWLKFKNTIAEYYTPHSLWSLAWIGFAAFALGLSGFIYNIIIYSVLLPPILPVKQSVILSVVWCFLTVIKGAILFWYARKYAHYAQTQRANLLPSYQRQRHVST